jgi:alpha-tubulin suppressor-like RCC1 family protein
VQRNTPTLVDDTRHWARVSGGQSHACATTLGGRLFCWGNIATGTDSGADVPTEVDPDGTAWSSVSAGGSHTCGIRVDETLWCWGLNSRGQLGTGGTPSEAGVPVQVGASTDWTSVSAGQAHTCGLRGTDLYCWGRNPQGAVGSGTPGSDDVTSPAQVPGSWAQVSASGSGNFDHTCGIDTVGRLWCWGSDDSGRLGLNGAGDQATPAQVGSGTTWTSVTAGGTFACAVKADDTQWCWGNNIGGELGIGSMQPSFATPQQLTT